MLHRFLLAAVPLAFASWLPAADLPPLPEAVTSFGAVISDGHLYTYGGHKAGTHEWSLDTTSGKLQRLNLDKPEKWEELAGGPPVQSPGLAAYAGKVYLIGGMQPQNKQGEKAVLRAQSHAMVYDPATKAWSKLPDLPEPRSSHEVTVLDGKLYVVGGWPLNTGKPEPKAEKKDEPAAGDRNVEREYHDAIWVLDLAKPEKWETIPQPFQRRAIGLVGSKGRLYVLGGMNEKNEVIADADVYSLETKTWSKLPEIPASGKAKAFGTAACELDGRVLASPNGGKVYVLDDQGKAWIEAGQLKVSRLFHQLEPWTNGRVIALGGTKSGETINNVEIVTISPPAAVSAR